MNDEQAPLPLDIVMSPTITKIAPALVAAQAMMGGASKDKSNPFYKSKYADLAEVIFACKHALNENSICFLQPILSGVRGVNVTTMLLHSSGEWIKSTVEFPVAKLDSQEYGKAVSYARRYSLQAFLSIPSEDDDGNAASGKATPPTYTAAMTESFPPGISLKGRLVSLAAGVDGAPGTAKIQGEDGLMVFQVFAIEPHWHGYIDKDVTYRYEKQGKFRVIAEMKVVKAVDVTRNLDADPQATAPPKAVTPLKLSRMTQGDITSVFAGPGLVTKLTLALRDGDLECTTVLKPAKLGVANWHDAVGATVFFLIAPKDPGKIIDIMSYQAYEQAQQEAAQ